MLDEFLNYIQEQVGQPYLWGGQHTKLRPSDYVSIIQRKEEDATHEKNALAFCRKKFAAGATVLYAYDCSGLGMYWLYNLKKVYSGDKSANSMMAKCTIVSGKPKRGYWVFRVKNGRAYHIGYMVSDTEVIHAKGRAYGVVKEQYKSSYWNAIGMPKCFADDIAGKITPTPESKPVSDSYTFTRVLKYGRKGEDVKELKAALLAKGYGGLTLSNGNFYGSTRKVVRQFQQDNGLEVDGIAGRNTYNALGVPHSL